MTKAVLVLRTDDPIDFTVSNAVGIEKGSIVKLKDPRMAVIPHAQADVLAGITHKEKIASDGRTQLSVFRKGIFRLIASGSITVGDAVAAGATADTVYTPAVTVKSGSILGHSLETVTTGQTVEIDVDVGSGSQGVA